MGGRPHDDAMAEVFRNNPAYARELLNEILADGAMGEAMIVLRQMSKAFGGGAAHNGIGAGGTALGASRGTHLIFAPAKN